MRPRGAERQAREDFNEAPAIAKPEFALNRPQCASSIVPATGRILETRRSVLFGRAGGSGLERDHMACAVTLGREIAHILGRGPPGDAVLRYHIQPGPAQGRGLFGIVGHDAYAPDSELAQHLGREVEAASIEFEPQRLVGLVGVAAMRLKLVGANFAGDSIPATLLVEVEQ